MSKNSIRGLEQPTTDAFGIVSAIRAGLNLVSYLICRRGGCLERPEKGREEVVIKFPAPFEVIVPLIPVGPGLHQSLWRAAHVK
jgi:hypothetical protein